MKIFIIILLAFQAGNCIKANANEPFTSNTPPDVAYDFDFDQLPSDVTYSSFWGMDENGKLNPDGDIYRAGGNMGGDNSNKMPVGEPGVIILLMLMIYLFFLYKKNRLGRKMTTQKKVGV